MEDDGLIAEAARGHRLGRGASVVLGAEHDLSVGQALDLATGVADEVRMLVVVVIVRAAGVVGERESEGAVAGIDAVGKPGVDEAVERAVDGDAVGAGACGLGKGRNAIKELLRAARALGPRQRFKNDQSAGRSTQVLLAEG